ncbi:MAG: ISL3 family transposase [Hafnia sp.]
MLSLPCGWSITDITCFPARIELLLQRRCTRGRCPECNQLSTSHYGFTSRKLQHMPAGGKMLLLHFRLQRFRCQNVQCQRLTFQQSIISIAQKYQRNTYNLNSLLVRYSLICGGEAGSRLAQLNGIRISGDTLIRRLIDFPLPDTNNLTNIGVDDWAWKKGHRYGTIIVDHDTHRPVALLQGRESAPLSEWLVHRPGIRVITRDRAGAYADGAMSGAPQAIQIADRWHLIRNACDHFERLVKRYWPSVKKSVNSPDICSAVQSETTAMPPTTISPQESVTRRLYRQRYEQMSQLKQQGVTQKEIAARLDISVKTVHRWLQAGGPPVASGLPRCRYVISREEQDWLRKQWDEGCRNAAHLYRRLKTRGFKGSMTTVRYIVSEWRTAIPEEHRALQLPAVNQIVQWLLYPEEVTDLQKQELIMKIKKSSPVISRGSELTRRFISLFSKRDSNAPATLLRKWQTDALSSGMDEYRSFITRMESDFEAIKNALMYSWSNGLVEGHVNRLKTLKRQMYGRAGFELLRRRVLIPYLLE